MVNGQPTTIPDPRWTIHSSERMAFHSKYKFLFSIGLLSSAIIAFQIALMQILSIVQWYHFAYMVISVALLGFGAAGTVLSLFRQKLLAHSDVLLPLLMIVTGIAMALVTDISLLPFVHFDSYLLFAEYKHFGNLLLTYLLFFIPFFIGALSIGLLFVKYVDDIGKIYFANLLGSGAGGILALALIWLFFPKQLPGLIAILPVVSGMIIIGGKKQVFLLIFAGAGVAVCIWKIIVPPQLVLSQYKDLSKTLLLPDARITLEKSSPYGLIQTVTSPVLRYAPGLSLTAKQTAKVNMSVFANGDWFGAVTDQSKTDTSFILNYTTLALPYIMSERNHSLVLRSGTGIDVAHALNQGVESVVAVEPNPVITSILRKGLAGGSRELFNHPRVTVQSFEPRTFLLMDTGRYDLIILPVVGTFGGSAGLYAMQEQFILTKEALREMWFKLNDGGAITVTSWMEYPVRNPLKILATAVEVLEGLGVENTANHLAAIRSWGTITFVITRSPLTEKEISRIRSFCETMMFDPAILPGLGPEERSRYNQLQDNSFFDYIDHLFSPERDKFYADYDFNIQPATDNKPYFSQFIKWKSLPRLAGIFGNRSIPFLEIGYLLVILTLLQISVLSFVLIILPLFKIRWKGKNRSWIVPYFSGIGLGYMFVEMVFIQRFILYFGNPVYAASTVITSLLIFSGVGSYASKYFLLKPKNLLIVFSAIILFLFAYSFLLTPLLQRTIHLRFVYKFLIVLLTIAPPAFLMGMPFPAGLTYISKMDATAIPWAWGLNGCISVISTALATIVAVELGFMWVMWFAALAYCLPFMASIKFRYQKNHSLPYSDGNGTNENTNDKPV